MKHYAEEGEGGMKIRVVLRVVLDCFITVSGVFCEKTFVAVAEGVLGGFKKDEWMGK